MTKLILMGEGKKNGSVLDDENRPLIFVYDGLAQLKKDYPLFPKLKAKIEPFYCQECSLLRCTGCKLKATIGQVDLEME